MTRRSEYGCAKTTRVRDRVVGARSRPRAFSLVELLVVLSVAALLIALMLPGLASLRESARRVVCGSNMHQMAIALDAFTSDSGDRLPNSYFAGDRYRPAHPEQMMMVHRGDPKDGWDGIGRLYSRRYLSGPGAYYCPSNTSSHSLARYEERFTRSNTLRIFANYHYRGTFDYSLNFADPIDRHLFHDLRMERPAGMALLADGLRTKTDFSHVQGTNLLRDDLSVRWLTNPRIYNSLPSNANEHWPRNNIWSQLDEGVNGNQQSHQ